MLDFEAIRNFIVHQLHQFTERSVVPQNDPGERPGYPFHAYHFIAPYTPGIGRPVEAGKVVTDEDGKQWWEQERREFPTMTMSLSTYAGEQAACMEAALQVRRFFEFDGVDDLYTFGIVVVEVTPIADRTVLLDDQRYERRLGFDVIIGVTSRITRLIDFIERVEINDVEYRVG